MDESKVKIFPLSPKEIARFWSKVDKTAGYGIGDCWKWAAALNNGETGYGRFALRRNGRKLPVAAHRLSFELNGGTIPDGMRVMHVCDLRACVNPSHLLLGTAAHNTADMMVKGRSGRGRYRSTGGIHLRVSELAVARGYSLQRLCEACQSHPSLVMSFWYNRVKLLRLDVLSEISQVLGVEPNELLERAA